MRLRIGLLLMVFSFFACTKSSTDVKSSSREVGVDLSKLDWMLGKWKNEDTGELELWSKKEQSFFGGMMVEINEKDKAVIQEVLSLEGRQDGIYLSSKGSGTSNNKRIEFKMSNRNFDAPKFTSQTETSPKHVSYMRVGSDKIKVALIGSNGVETSFYYIREI